MNLRVDLRKIISFFVFPLSLYKIVSKNRSLIILNYHRILPLKEVKNLIIQPGMYVEEKVFERQILFLKKYFHILSFPEYLRKKEDKDMSLNKRYCLITFDDGWLDNYEYAFPILKKYNIPATIFIPVSFIGTNRLFWQDKIAYILKHANKEKTKDIFKLASKYEININKLLHEFFASKTWERKILLFDQIINQLKKERYELICAFITGLSSAFDLSIKEREILNWSEIKEMSRKGISFGSHGMNHKILTRLSLKKARFEIQESHHILCQKRDINYVPVFSYPNGDYNSEICKIVAESGYKAAVTAKFGYNDIYYSPDYTMYRIGIHNDIASNKALFSFHLAGFNQFRK